MIVYYYYDSLFHSTLYQSFNFVSFTVLVKLRTFSPAENVLKCARILADPPPDIGRRWYKADNPPNFFGAKRGQFYRGDACVTIYFFLSCFSFFLCSFPYNFHLSRFPVSVSTTTMDMNTGMADMTGMSMATSTGMNTGMSMTPTGSSTGAMSTSSSSMGGMDMGGMDMGMGSCKITVRPGCSAFTSSPCSRLT